MIVHYLWLSVFLAPEHVVYANNTFVQYRHNYDMFMMVIKPGMSQLLNIM